MAKIKFEEVLQMITKQAIEEIENAQTLEELNLLKIKYLKGRRSFFRVLTKLLGNNKGK